MCSGFLVHVFCLFVFSGVGLGDGVEYSSIHPSVDGSRIFTPKSFLVKGPSGYIWLNWWCTCCISILPNREIVMVQSSVFSVNVTDWKLSFFFFLTKQSCNVKIPALHFFDTDLYNVFILFYFCSFSSSFLGEYHQSSLSLNQSYLMLFEVSYFTQSQVLIVQKFLRGSRMAALGLQCVPVMGDNAHNPVWTYHPCSMELHLIFIRWLSMVMTEET